MQRRAGFASQQIFDNVVAVGAVGASSFGGLVANGTKFPVLPNQSFKLWNIGYSVETDAAAGLIQVQSAGVFLNFYNGADSLIGSLPLFGDAWASPGAALNGDEAGILGARDGDPLLEFASNMLMTGVINENGGTFSFVQVVSYCEVKNTDASSHNMQQQVTAILSFVPRT